jgi:tRNA(fMet)-specific endonuclease VapC
VNYLLDANTVSYYLRGVPATVQRIQRQKPSTLALSSVTAMELTYGVEKRRSPTLAAAVRGFISGVQVMPFDDAAAHRAGALRALTERSGIALSLADSMIAGHALARGCILVSTDAVFARVRGLRTEDWS